MLVIPSWTNALELSKKLLDLIISNGSTPDERLKKCIDFLHKGSLNEKEIEIINTVCTQDNLISWEEHHNELIASYAKDLWEVMETRMKEENNYDFKVIVCTILSTLAVVGVVGGLIYGAVKLRHKKSELDKILYNKLRDSHASLIDKDLESGVKEESQLQQSDHLKFQGNASVSYHNDNQSENTPNSSIIGEYYHNNEAT